MDNPISLCMIVRDEEAQLRRCLDSAAGCVDEVVVLDTGSADRTVEVAAGCGARVIRTSWRDDFALARNLCLGEATGQWILVLDADEELPAGAAGLLRELAAGEPEAWTCVVEIPAEEGTTVRQPALRLFRNRKAYRFEGLVYEQVRPAILRSCSSDAIRDCHLVIRHHGYPGGRRADGKTRRNIRLLESALSANPFDPFLNYNLGVNQMAAGEEEAARTRFEIALLAVDGRSWFSPGLYLDYTRCLFELGDFTGCLKLLEEGLGHFPDYPDLHFHKGRLYEELGLWREAEACFTTCTGYQSVPAGYTTVEGITGYLSQERLAETAWKRGDLEEAARRLAEACRYHGARHLRRRLGLLLRQAGLAGCQLRQALAGYLEGEDLVHLLFDLGEYEACLAEASADSVILRAACLNRTGRPAEALELLAACAGGGPGKAREKELAELLLGVSRPGEAQAGELVVEAALAMWLSGERERALDLAGRKYGEKARCELAARTLAADRPETAVEILAGTQGETACPFLLGRALAQLGRHREACACFLSAGDTYVRAALEQALNHCQMLVRDLLQVEERNAALQMELFRLASRRKKLARYAKSNGR